MKMKIKMKKGDERVRCIPQSINQLFNHSIFKAMKNLPLTSGLLIAYLMFVLSACAQPENETPKAFQEQLKAVFDASQTLNEALVASDPVAAQAAATMTSKALDAVDMHLLDDAPHMTWMEQLGTMVLSLKTISGSSDLDVQREALAPFSEALKESVKTFGIAGTAYLQYCPMANGNTGASWLSSNKEILNPYFGASMLHCGSTKEVIE